MLVHAPLRQRRPDLRCGGGFGAALVALLLGGLLLAPAAHAAYQQVGNFAGNPGELHEYGQEHAALWPEEVQLGGLGGMAVNYTGAGGVPAGTIYAATHLETTRVARYNPDESFSEAWEVRTKEQEEESEGKGEDPYERCGPEGDPAYPNCPPGLDNGAQPIDVEVDQTTGNVYVYVYYLGLHGPGTPLITEYSPDGSEVIARFAERAVSSEHVPESPAKVHSSSPGGGAITVNAAGEVYVFDLDGTDNFYHRLMLFKPKTPGDYTEYEYAGQGHDIAAGFLNETEYPAKPVTDTAGYVYVAGYDHVEKYDPAQPGDPPICSFLFKKGQITGMTINPLTGEAFFYSFTDKKLHRLNPCAEGKFSEAETIEISPKRDSLSGMAVDPTRLFGPGRAVGTLYAGAPSGQGGEQKGTSPSVEVESSMGYVFAPPSELPPEVLSEAVGAVTQSSARLEGQLDPRGNLTRYSFQYIPDTAYQANEPSERFAGAREAPPGGALVGGSKALAAAAAVEGLAPGTEYHVRLVATSHCSSGEPAKECTAEGAGRTFRTYSVQSAGLPDRRAYELVSPTEKNGGQVFPANPAVSSCPAHECKPGSAYNHFPLQSTPDGDGVVYEGNAFSFDEGALIENEYISRRTDSGWQTVNLTPSLLSSKGRGGYQAFSADLGLGLLEGQDVALSPDAPPGFYNLYTQPSAEPLSLTPLLSEAPPNRVPGHTNSGVLQLSYAGASADFSRIFFAANDALTPEAEGGPEAKRNLYESSGGALHLLNFAPGNASTLPGAVFGSGTLLRRGDGNNPESFIFHAISKDGSRAFWTSEEDGHLYVREDGQTLEVPDPGSCAASLKPEERTCFLSAAADGSRVLLSDGLLFDVESLAAPPVDLTQGKGGFEGLVGQSEDLSRAYFVDTAALTGEEENEYGAKAEEGKPNLYAWHEGETSFIATLSFSSSGNWWRLAPVHRSASASPDGRWLAFLTEAPLTGFDNTGPCEVISGTEFFNPGPCEEAFLYEADTGALRCPSCNPTETAPHGPTRLPQLASAGNTPVLPPPRYLTDSGRLFFDSQDSLSPFDTNGRVEDVYEFEPGGVGDCTAQAGCVRLISGGRSGFDSNFLAADPSAENIFLTSRDQLVRADKDALIDLYDAREDGGFPPSVAAGECQGEACLPSVSPPNDPTPASAGLEGAGNVPKARSKRCPKGRHALKRKGKARCVKRHVKRQGRGRHERANDTRGGAR
jgi:hypothetical protein